MKKIILMVLLIFMPISFVEAYPNEPNGYGQLYWGENLHSVEQTYRTDYVGSVFGNQMLVYLVTIPDSNGESGITGTVKAFCGFMQDHLVVIYMSFGDNTLNTNNTYATTAQNYLTTHCGLPIKQGKIDVWNGKNTFMSFDEIPGGVELKLVDSSFARGLAIGFWSSRSEHQKGGYR